MLGKKWIVQANKALGLVPHYGGVKSPKCDQNKKLVKLSNKKKVPQKKVVAIFMHKMSVDWQVSFGLHLGGNVTFFRGSLPTILGRLPEYYLELFVPTCKSSTFVY